MEKLFSRLELNSQLKQGLKHWCHQNGLKISFTVNMTLSKSKNIYRKLENTYKKSQGKLKSRWLENELKLFHFVLISVSFLHAVKIQDFSIEEWAVVSQAFPFKIPGVLEYEAKNFINSNFDPKLKWISEEELILSKIVQARAELKWNEIATQLFIDSDRLYFRSGKQCRQRWLNHLDSSVRHQKWTHQQDLTLLRGIMKHGKKWSRLIACFNGCRTEHMIKNRFLSLLLKCKKSNPDIQDDDFVTIKIFQEYGIWAIDDQQLGEEYKNERRLRPKKVNVHQQQQGQISVNYNIENEMSQQNIQGTANRQNEPKQPFQTEILIPEMPEPLIHSTPDIQAQLIECCQNNATIPTPSPSAFVSPLAFMGCNSFMPNLPNFGYFQCYMNDFYSHLNSGNQNSHN